jgi:short-subunit dehydrogenase
LEETFHVNVVGLNIVTKEFLPLLREGKGKKIVNM